MGRLETYARDAREQTLSYLARRPYDNVFVSWLIATGQAARGEVLVWRDASKAIAGVCYYGMQIVPFADDDAAIDAFADRARRFRGARMIVGPRENIERFWPRVRDTMDAPTAIRASQPVYALTSRAAIANVGGVTGDAGRATRDELDEIVPQSAAMIAGELGGDPSRASVEFRARTGRIIDARWSWRYRVDGRLAFICNVGAVTPFTAQLQGVWTPPELRGQGHAARGLAAISRLLLDEFPTLSLYVNDFNTSAIALYERVGFTRVGEFRTILFG